MSARLRCLAFSSLVAALCACARTDLFVPFTDEGDGGGDVVLGLATFAPGRFTAMEVDWANQLAYLSSADPRECFDVVDFSVETAPRQVARFGLDTTPATACQESRGIKLFDGDTKLVATGVGGTGKLEIWDVGASPRTLNFSQLAFYSVGHPRRIPRVEKAGDNFSLYVAHRNGAKRYTFAAAAAPPSITLDATWIGSDNQADAAVVDLKYFLSASWNGDQPIFVIDIPGMTTQYAIDMTCVQDTDTYGLWVTAVSSDQAKIFFGGRVSAFLQYLPGAPVEIVPSYRFDNPSTYRDAVFVEDHGETFLYGLRSDILLDVFDVTDIDAPALVYQTTITGATAEAYGVRVDTATRRAAIATTNGDFVILRIDAMTPATTAYPTF